MFIAIVPPQQAVEDLADFVEPRRDRNTVAGRSGPRSRTGTGPDDSALRWTDPAHWHLTLAFLPSVPDDALDDLTERLSSAAGKRASLGLALGGAGTFPNPADGKVLWTGVRGDLEELARCSVGARNAANAAGVPVEGGKFHPHLTIARVNRPADLSKWLQVFDSYSGPTWRADEIELVESHLGQGPHGRPIYRTVARFSLG